MMMISMTASGLFYDRRRQATDKDISISDGCQQNLRYVICRQLCTQSRTFTCFTHALLLQEACIGWLAARYMPSQLALLLA